MLGAIEIGEHSRIGANSVVLRDVPGHSTVIGIPGTVVGKTDTIIQGGRINLDHHAMPNPVDEAIRHVMKLVDDVNARVDELHPEIKDGGHEKTSKMKKTEKDMRKEHKDIERFLGGGGI